MLQDAGFEVLAVSAGAAHRGWLLRPGTFVVEALSWEDANADILALDCISFNISTRLGVFGCGQLRRPAPEVCGAGSDGL
jgi:hypothetical protein